VRGVSLHALQCALAELFTDSGARERFARDPGGFAAARGLGEREREQLAALSASAIPGYAATLVRKQRAAAARLPPRKQAASWAKRITAWVEGVRAAASRP
jgi:hypothetical protein